MQCASLIAPYVYSLREKGGDEGQAPAPMISTLGSAMTRIGPLTLENASGSAVLNGLDKGKAGSNFLLSVQFDVVGQVGMRNRTGHVLDSITIRRRYSHLFLSRCHIRLVERWSSSIDTYVKNVCPIIMAS